VSARTVFAPAKLNLFLAITGRRPDGFHDLVSVVAPLDWGDTLALEPAPPGVFTLACETPGIPLGDDNLVLRAAKGFAKASGWGGGVRFTLTKAVPAGAGLGGGSSDGTAALLALNARAGEPLAPEALASLAAELGSDCVLFLKRQPCVMRGRGERVDVLPEGAARRLRGQRVLLFKPWIGINTAWAYRQMAAAAPALYLPADEAERRLQGWLADPAAPLDRLLFNNMETVAFEKHLALPTLLSRLRTGFGLAVGMSGSGSACFALLPENAPVEAIAGCIRDAWGAETFLVETRLA
jgi:4-diphosphocytidyl-2-C-methyl-D-erythritol kinase